MIEWIFVGLPKPDEPVKRLVASFLIKSRIDEEDGYCLRTAKKIAKQIIAPNIKELSTDQRHKAQFVYDKLLTGAKSNLEVLYKDAVRDVGEEFISPPAKEEWQALIRRSNNEKNGGSPSVW